MKGVGCIFTHGFSDAGRPSESALSATMTPFGPESPGPNPLVVTTLVDGPLSVEGRMTVIDPSGAIITRAKAALCRCGASANKPFCDGSHRRIGFLAP